jgi:cobalt-precorrin 5A hydrolase
VSATAGKKITAFKQQKNEHRMRSSKRKKYAVWAITPNGVRIAKAIAEQLPDVDIFLSAKLFAGEIQATTFGTLVDCVSEQFRRYDGHVFIMATGIVVRMIAPLIQSKLEDPAVVVVDDRGRHAVSLISGHIGGANALAIRIAECIGADPVITTATDVNRSVAIDVLAREKQLVIENPGAIKTVNMSLLKGESICLHDPFDTLQGAIPDAVPWPYAPAMHESAAGGACPDGTRAAYVFIDDKQVELPAQALALRPRTLTVGIGCNRGTAMEEIKALLERVLEQNHLSRHSLTGLASIRLKADEAGLLALAENLALPLSFYDRQELNQVETIKNPSFTVEKHVGVKSVCEAAAILAAQNGPLVVPKQTTRNATIAVARIASMSSA